MSIVRISESKAKMSIRGVTAEAMMLDLANRTTFQGDNFMGAPVSGLDELNMGVLPQRYRAKAKKAKYAVLHHGTPILWCTRAGVWEMPVKENRLKANPAKSVEGDAAHFWSTTTNQLRAKLISALDKGGQAHTGI